MTQPELRTYDIVPSRDKICLDHSTVFVIVYQQNTACREVNFLANAL